MMFEAAENLRYGFPGGTATMETFQRSHSEENCLSESRAIRGPLDQPGSEDLHCLCSETFTAGGGLAEHFVTRHTGLWPYACMFCKKHFSLKTELEEHLRVHASDRPEACEECGMKFVNAFVLASHHFIHTSQTKLPLEVAKYTEEQPYPCPLCENRFATKRFRKVHLATHIGATVKEEDIPLNENGHEVLESSVKKQRFKCVYCGKKLANPVKFRVHLLNHKKKERYSCPQCEKKFEYKSNLYRHVQSHNVDLLFKCTQCPRSFPRACDLNDHHRKHFGKGSFECKSCRKLFKTRALRKEHKAVHRNDKKFSCPKCSKSFKTQDTLKEHLERHSEIKSFECDVCSKNFFTLGELKAHSFWHTKQSSYVCEMCLKHFPCRSALVTHLRVHTKEKPLFCDECGKGFTTISNRKVHMRTHTDERPYACKECSKAFHYRTQLTRHMVLH